MEFNYVTYILLGLVALLFLRKYFAGRNLVNYTAAEAKEKQKNNSIIMLDVRTGAERKVRQIKDSIHIPLSELKSRLNELEKFKSKQIVCYCASGSRSVSAAALLNKSGFNAANLRGGISQWS